MVAYLSEFKGFKFDKSLQHQIKSLADTPFMWIDTEEALYLAVIEIKTCLFGPCNALAVDLEYHNVERKAIILSLI
jgi:hypothetical protein